MIFICLAYKSAQLSAISAFTPLQKRESKLLTCSYPESGVDNLTPAGVILIGSSALKKSKIEAMKHATEELGAIAIKEGFSYVFNVKFTEGQGIPPSLYKAFAIGDAYIQNEEKQN